MRVYSVTGVAPEIQAYAMAKYSRSSQSMLESIGELSAQQATTFLESFYFQYGHRSIADLAHLFLAVEDISILAAIQLEDEPLWDGQERSTRYQPFHKTGYIVPAELQGEAADAFQAEANALFSEYQALSRDLLDLLVQHTARPDAMDEKVFRRTLRARAFDVARGLLPLATATSVGQVVSARVLEAQISRLLADEHAEIRQVAEALRDSCTRPAERPALQGVQAALEALAQSTNAEHCRPLIDAVHTLLEPQPAAPTLVKYTQPDTYRPAVLAFLREQAKQLLGRYPADLANRVQLTAGENPMDAMLAAALFAADDAGHSYRQALCAVQGLPAERREALLDGTFEPRGLHDDLLRLHRASQPLTYDLLIDIGAFRDFHRHRRCVQFLQPLSAALGTDDACWVFEQGLGVAAKPAFDAGLHHRYAAALDRALAASNALANESAPAARYLLPLATRCRAMFNMDLAEAAYIAEQRSKPAGHFSYRTAAWEMAESLGALFPEFRRHVRATDATRPIDLLDR